MGLFYESTAATAAAPVISILTDAFTSEKLNANEAQAEAEAKAPAVTAAAVAANAGQFQPARFFGALAIVAVLVLVGVIAEANGWKDSSKAVFGLAATAFGVVVGFLGGEKA